jgi:plasmid stability protein
VLRWDLLNLCLVLQAEGMKQSQARKQLRFMADEHLQAALEVRAAAHGVTVSALCTAILATEMRRGVQNEMMLELTPTIKNELRKGFQGAARELRALLVRTAFEASLTRLLWRELYEKPQAERDPFDMVLRRLLPQAKERVKDPFYGLEEFMEPDEMAKESRLKKHG